MTTVYSTDEVSLHNNANDLWMIIHDGVYNLTKFLKEHPGGEEVLLALAGMDGTTCFDEMGHTTEAVQLRETFKIGIITEGKGDASDMSKSSASNTKKTKLTVNDDDNWEYQERKSDSSNFPSILIGTVGVIYAIIFYYWYL